MIKKIITYTIGAMLIFSLNASAEKNCELSAFISSKDFVISKINADIPDGNCVAAIYLDDNTLFTAAPVTISDGSAVDLSLTVPADKGYTLKLYSDIGSDSFISLGSGDILTLPSDETDNEITDTPVIDKEEPPSDDTKPDINYNTVEYLDSLAVVQEAGHMLDEYSDTLITYIDVLYLGEEIQIKLEENYYITEAATGFENMIKTPASKLEKGDILQLNANLSGSLTGLKFVFRTPDTDVIVSEEDKSLFITSDEYVFGLLAKKLNNNELVIYNQSRLESEAQYINLENNAFVYKYDTKKRLSKPELSHILEVSPSTIVNSDYDEDDNIISWAEGRVHNYVFARLYDGVVYDLVVYENYISEK